MVVAMPDFFLDYVLAFPGELDQIARAMVDVAERGGGNLLGWKHLVGRGGNTWLVEAETPPTFRPSSQN